MDHVDGDAGSSQPVDDGRHFDVVIMGGGIAGNFQARHLALKIPGLRVALIDPRHPDEVVDDRKVGESLIEISALFMAVELDLYDYLIETHRYKHGLNYHWPRKPEKTANIDDYFSLWQQYNAPIPSFQIHRGILERDLLRMNEEKGVRVLQGSVKSCNLRSQGNHEVQVELCAAGVKQSARGEPATPIIITADFVVDASGRRQILGKKLQNVMYDAKELRGLATGSSWVRVRGVNRDLFKRSDASLHTLSSRYNGTNHFMGKGHWCWMIPIANDELSIGVVYHKRMIDETTVRNQAGLVAFLKKHQRLLANLIESGDVMDFGAFRRLPFLSRKYFSGDRWAVIGEASFFLDPFYSTGIAFTSIQVECTTELIRAHRAGKCIRRKVEAYDRFVHELLDRTALFYDRHGETLGHASAMSWRVYVEFMRYVGEGFPMYMGKFFLDEDFTRIGSFYHGAYKRYFDVLIDTLVDCANQNRNIGFPDPYVHDLYRGGISPVYHDYVIKQRHYDPQRLNLPFLVGWTHLTAMRCLATVTQRTYGARGLLRPRHLLVQSEHALTGGAALVGGALHWWRHRDQPKNRYLRQRAEDFKHYRADDAFYGAPFFGKREPRETAGESTMSVPPAAMGTSTSAGGAAE